MNDIQEKFASREEVVYLGRADSIMAYPGIKRAKLVWQVNADPKITQTIIYWNNRKDSLVKPFSRTKDGVQKDSVIVENIRVGSTFFEIVNVNNEGQRSVASSISVIAWSGEPNNGLLARNVPLIKFDVTQSAYYMEFSKSQPGDSVVYSQIVYVDKNNVTQTVNVPKGSNSIFLPNFPGGEFQFRSVFFPPQGIDTLYSSYSTYKSPALMRTMGVKINLVAAATKRYFDYKGDLGVYNTVNGDLEVYSIAADGTPTLKKTYPAITSSPGVSGITSFAQLFYYPDEDMFFGQANTGGIGFMHLENDSKVVFNNNKYIATGYGPSTFVAFSAGKGCFYAAAPPYFLRAYTFKTDNSFITSAQVFPGASMPSIFTVFDYKLFLAIKSQDLQSYTIPAGGVFDGSTVAPAIGGYGFGRFSKIFGVGTNLYGIQGSDIYVFNNFSLDGKFWIVN